MIAVLGYANLDLVAHVPTMPARDDRTHATSITPMVGGMGVNAAIAAAGLGAEVTFLGRYGADDGGQRIAAALRSAGVDVSKVRHSARTTICIVLVDADGERAIVSEDDDLDARDVLAALDLLADSGGGWLYLDGYRLPAACEALEGRSPEVSVVVDLDGLEDPGALARIAATADHLVVGATHLAALSGEPDPAVAAQQLAGHGPVVVLTRGSAGWSLYQPASAPQHAPAFPIDAVDTTGAGDAFCGAYLAGLAEGRHPARAASLAGAAAALVTTHAGAGGDRITCEAVQALIAAHPSCVATEGERQ